MREPILTTFMSKEVDIHRIQEGLVLINGDNVIEIRNKRNLEILKQHIEDILGEEDWVRSQNKITLTI